MESRAQAYWLEAPGKAAIRETMLALAGTDDVLVRTLYSGISRGTESLVFRGGVPSDQYDVMRAPFQDGTFPGPVKYGYLNVGMVEDGPDALVGQTVFCLYPHQTRYVVPANAVVPVPNAVPERRAVLAGMLETALNALWDARPCIGDRIAVIGAGVVGCCVARLLARIPAVDVTLVDVDPSRAAVAAVLGAPFALPGDACGDCDLTFHASASAAGLQTALDLLGSEGEVIDLSWYGDRKVEVALGGGFHSRRLAIRASQVGMVAPARRLRRSRHERLALALDLLVDEAFDVLLTDVSPFNQLPETMAAVAGGQLPGLCHVISYEEE